MVVDLRYDADVSDIRTHWEIMKGWRWNLIPMFIIQLFTTVLIVVDAGVRRRTADELDWNVQWQPCGYDTK